MDHGDHLESVGKCVSRVRMKRKEVRDEGILRKKDRRVRIHGYNLTNRSRKKWKDVEVNRNDTLDFTFQPGYLDPLRRTFGRRAGRPVRASAPTDLRGPLRRVPKFQYLSDSA